jgi:guanylate kinase
MSMIIKPKLFIFTGTSGSGRKTIARAAVKDLNLQPVVSYTTRPQRMKETNGLDYHFITREQFKEGISQGLFFQVAEIDHHWYGTKNDDLIMGEENPFAQYLIVNRQAAEVVKNKFGAEAIRLFIYVNKQTLRERLEAKGASYDLITRYIDQYPEEVTYRKYCEHVFENLDLNHTVEEVKKTIKQYL